MKKMIVLLAGLFMSTAVFSAASTTQEQTLVKNLEQKATAAQHTQEKNTQQAKWSRFVEQHRKEFLTNAAKEEYDYSLKNCERGIEILMDKGVYAADSATSGPVFQKHFQREKISEGVTKQENADRVYYFIHQGPVLMLYSLANDFYSHAESAAGKTLRWVSTDAEGHETAGELFTSYPGHISMRCL